MKKLFVHRPLYIFVCWSLILSLLSACYEAKVPDKELEPDAYAQIIQEERDKTDRWMRSDSGSPILDKEKFEGIAYFAPNQDYIVKAKLELIDDGKIIEIPTNTGKVRRFVRYAKARFNHKEQPYEVTLLKSIDAPKVISLLFTDETSGKSTYEAGRYLEPEINGTFVWLDFNRAYQPYCAYNETFDCPIPPKENHLNFEIKAGEKMP
ncbi:MAG: DUF1684 domain-containing protein [Bernardetiaceae bacterium]|nr:DUF1684 domain-containing protein [Bernardetiaceae bacterium]